jgi:hypothetical protein
MTIVSLPLVLDAVAKASLILAVTALVAASLRRASASSTSRAAAGDVPAASLFAHAAGCLTFHHRTPPTWLCAPGPTPHQSPPVQ